MDLSETNTCRFHCDLDVKLAFSRALSICGRDLSQFPLSFFVYHVLMTATVEIRHERSEMDEANVIWTKGEEALPF